MTNLTDVSDVKMTRFGNRVYLFRERHVRVKDKAKIASRGTDWDRIPLYIKKLFNGFALISGGVRGVARGP